MVKNKCICTMAAVTALSLVIHAVRVKAADSAAPASPKASAPSPKDGATDARRDGTTLSWTPGGTTGKYDVYFGTVRKYIERVERTNPVYVQASLGQKAKTLNPGRLELGQTYYWRVDEVNDLDPNNVKVSKGDIWSFMVEVPALPVADVTATASCVSGDNNEPQKTVDSSGLSAGKHSAEAADMWLSCVALAEPKDPNDPNSALKPAPATSIQFKFGKVQRLYDMSIWNWNAKDSLDYGVKDITVEYSPNGTDWTAVGDFTLAKGSGEAGYVCNNVISLAGITATRVRITVNSGFGASGQYGLSEVKFSAIPVYAREASPASGAKNIPLDGTLNWRTGREAVSHKVFISTDRGAVEKGTAPSFKVTTNSFKLTSLDVQLEKTYYWRVDEVNDAMDPESFAGDIWSFSAVDYLVVEDFEKYKGDVSKTWATPGDTVVSTVRNIVHAGTQALAISSSTIGGARDTWATGTNPIQKNWAKNGVKKLVLFVHGDPGNWDEPIVLAINGTNVGSFGAIQNPWWGCWIVDLTVLGSTLESVDSITIGHTPGFGIRRLGTENLYIDDIRVYNTKTPSLPDIVDKLIALNTSGATKGQFDTLVEAVTASDVRLLETLSSDETYTVFAPTNAAFRAAGVSAGTDAAILKDILRNQIVAKNVSATNKGSLKTLEGSTVIQDASIVTDDLGGEAAITASAEALNGTIHVVDAVLMPFQMAKLVDILKSMNKAGDYAGQFDTLLAGIGAAKATVRDMLNKRHETLFAPTDDAFAALGYDADSIKTVDQSLLSDILLYHIASGRLMGKDLKATIKAAQGGELKYSKDKLTDATGGKAAILGYDVEASNGVIHIIDAVALPFAKTKLLDVIALIASLNAAGDLAGRFDTLIAAAEAADPAVLGALAGKGPCTIFAPSDDAFAALGWDPNKVKTLDRVYLGDMLLYHAVAGKLAAKDAVAAKEIQTVQGGVITRDPNDPNNLLRGAFKGAAKITTPDLEAFNGLVHVIDAVLLPYEEPVPVVVPAPDPVVVPEPNVVPVPEPNVAPVPEPKPEPVLISILDTIAALNAAGDYAGQFDTFLAAVAAADKAVAGALSGAAENTLFLPTDDAFAALDPKIDSLDRFVVTDILLYHIAAGKLMAADMSAATSITMLKGGSLQQAENALTDNTGKQGKITGQDLKASNGVIHVIDAVLLPAKL